jgi:hypothetical protein
MFSSLSNSLLLKKFSWDFILYRLFCVSDCKVTEPKKVQPEPDQQKKIQVSKVPVQQKGLRVVARNDDDGFYYPGMICVTSDVSRVCIVLLSILALL